MDQETRRQVEAMQAMYPRPRVGQRVKLKSGRVVEIISVRRARDVLGSLQEHEAMILGPRMQALYGKHWLEVYFEAEAIVPGVPRILKIEPANIETIIGS